MCYVPNWLKEKWWCFVLGLCLCVGMVCVELSHVGGWLGGQAMVGQLWQETKKCLFLVCFQISLSMDTHCLCNQI